MNQDINIPLKKKWFAKLSSAEISRFPLVILLSNPLSTLIPLNSLNSPNTLPTQPSLNSDDRANASKADQGERSGSSVGSGDLSSANESKEGGAQSDRKLKGKKKYLDKEKIHEEDQYPMACEVTIVQMTPKASSGSASPSSASSSLQVDVSTAKIDQQLVITEHKLVLQIQNIYGIEDESLECTVCLTDPKDVILFPCRHACVCHQCLKNVRKCPVCRSLILNYAIATDPKELTNLILHKNPRRGNHAQTQIQPSL